mmetsp:Transcript_29583/g.68842  ORF Transcript_29583/g.68842 Transcript_29583/m.68842 type:complete len:141 (+) Transcript_29583:88-510(+)
MIGFFQTLGLKPVGRLSSVLGNLSCKAAVQTTASSMFMATVNNSLHRQQQQRSNYQLVISKRYDRKSGKMVYEDWNHLVRGVHRPSYKDGRSIQGVQMRQKRHIKKWMKKRKAKEQREYERDQKKVNDLLRYIDFMKDKH